MPNAPNSEATNDMRFAFHGCPGQGISITSKDHSSWPCHSKRYLRHRKITPCIIRQPNDSPEISDDWSSLSCKCGRPMAPKSVNSHVVHSFRRPALFHTISVHFPGAKLLRRHLDRSSIQSVKHRRRSAENDPIADRSRSADTGIVAVPVGQIRN